MSDQSFLLFKLLFGLLVSVFSESLQGFPFLTYFKKLVRDLCDFMHMLVYFEAARAVESLYSVVDAVVVATDVEDAIFAAAALGSSLQPHVIDDGH